MQKRLHYPNNGMKDISGEKQKFTGKDILIIVFGWLFALSLIYICYLKFKFFLHH
jgi:hypothetical protein